MAFKQTVSFLDLKSTVTFTDINGLVQYVNLSAVDVLLDAFSKDLFFVVGHPNALTLSITDSVDVITFSKVLADTPVLEEQAAIGFTLATQTESVSMGDNLVFFRKNFERSFTETVSLVDTASNDDPLTTDWSTGIGHSATLSESSDFAFATSFSDSMSMSEVLATSLAKALADTPSVSETLAHSFTKAIADSYSISEAVASSFAKPAADTTSVSETLARGFSKSVSDSATISESISVLHISGANSVLNASVLGTFAFN